MLQDFWHDTIRLDLLLMIEWTIFNVRGSGRLSASNLVEQFPAHRMLSVGMSFSFHLTDFQGKHLLLDEIILGFK